MFIGPAFGPRYAPDRPWLVFALVLNLRSPRSQPARWSLCTCAAVVALIRSIAPGDGEPVPESFASGAFMAVTMRTDAPLSESEIASAEAQLRDAQDPDGARMFRQLLAHFKSLAACRAMEPRRAARALADATIPTGNSDAARRALVDRSRRCCVRPPPGGLLGC